MRLPLVAAATSSPSSSTRRGFSDSGSDDVGQKGNLSEVYADLFGASDNAGTQQQTQQPQRRDQPRKDSVGTSSDGSFKVPEPLWTDNWEISDEEYEKRITFEELPIWSPEFVSRISKERVQLLGKYFYCRDLVLM